MEDGTVPSASSLIDELDTFKYRAQDLSSMEHSLLRMDGYVISMARQLAWLVNDV